MADGSSVRIKVAQYFVDKKLQELESKNPHVKIDDWTFLRALPQYPVYDPEPEPTQRAHDSGLEPDVDEPPQLPPLFPTPTGDDISWKDLLDYDRDRLNRGPPVVGDPGSPEQPRFPPKKPIYPPWYCVAIIGAGVAGLRTAKLLQDRGIPYKIFESSDRPGGRAFTYEFPSKPPRDPPGKHDYYDVGAMRFPDNDANQRTFALFKELGLSSKVQEYVISTDENILYYNCECCICMLRPRVLTEDV